MTQKQENTRSLPLKLKDAILHVRQNWSHYRALAGEEYPKKGRGCVVIDVGAKYCPSGAKGPSRTYADKESIKKMSDSFAILIRLYDYNPERQILFAFFDYKARKGQVLILGEREDGLPCGTGFDEYSIKSPPLGPGVLPIITLVPNSNKAENFEDLNCIITDIVSRKGVEALNKFERVVWDILELKYEVGNGGFMQFFSNCGGNWKRTLDALQLVKATDLCELFKRVCSVFPGGKPNDKEEVWDQLSKIIEQDDSFSWDEADSEFYDLTDSLQDIIWKFWTLCRDLEIR